MKDFDPFDPASTHSLWSATAELRRHQPVARLASGVVYVSRYHDVRAVLRRTKDFSSKGGFKAEGVEIPLGDASLGDFDEPEHGPARRLAMGAAGPSRVKAEEAYAAGVAADLVEAMAARGGTTDVVSAIALPLSSRVITHLLGAPLEQADQLFAWAEDIMHSPFPTLLRTERGVGYHGAFPEYAAFVDGLIDARLADPEPYDDAIARIVAALADGEAGPEADRRGMTFMIVSTLLLGGVTTTRDFIGWMLYEVVRRPELHEAVAADRELVPAVVEESLRLYPPVLYLMRRCINPTDIGGVPVAADDRVLVGLASANRDEDVYPDAEQFRIDRHDPPPHLSFGHGLHACVGNALARMEGAVTLNAFLDRFASGQVRITPEYVPELMPVPFMYGPLRVEVDVAG